MSLREFTEENFDSEVLQSDLPVVVDLWAPWCGPCKMLTPILEELSQEYDGKVLFAKVNVDDNPQIAVRYSVVSIPTMLFIKNGEVLDTQVGLVAKDFIKEKIESMLN